MIILPACMHTGMCTVYMPGTQRPEKSIRFSVIGIMDSCELPFGARTEPWSFARAAGAPNQRAIFPSSLLYIYIPNALT